MTEHVASGVEGHPRRSTDWRLAIGAGEIDTAGSQGVDMRCVQGRMAVAAHIVSPELVTHDEENVAYGAHRSASLPNCRFPGNKGGEELSEHQPWRFSDNPTILDVQCQRSARIGFPWRVPQDYHLGVQLAGG